MCTELTRPLISAPSLPRPVGTLCSWPALGSGLPHTARSPGGEGRPHPSGGSGSPSAAAPVCLCVPCANAVLPAKPQPVPLTLTAVAPAHAWPLWVTIAEWASLTRECPRRSGCERSEQRGGAALVLRCFLFPLAVRPEQERGGGAAWESVQGSSEPLCFLTHLCPQALPPLPPSQSQNRGQHPVLSPTVSPLPRAAGSLPVPPASSLPSLWESPHWPVCNTAKPWAEDTPSPTQPCRQVHLLSRVPSPPAPAVSAWPSSPLPAPGGLGSLKPADRCPGYQPPLPWAPARPPRVCFLSIWLVSLCPASDRVPKGMASTWLAGPVELRKAWPGAATLLAGRHALPSLFVLYSS